MLQIDGDGIEDALEVCSKVMDNVKAIHVSIGVEMPDKCVYDYNNMALECRTLLSEAKIIISDGELENKVDRAVFAEEHIEEFFFLHTVIASSETNHRWFT